MRQARVEAVERLAEVVRQREAAFVVVAGDLFDASTVSQATVAAACGAIGQMGVPVYVIPGNHDHGGAGSIWEQPFFQRERESRAPNLEVLLKREPVEVEGAVLFPCPLLRRHESLDPAAWLRGLDLDSAVAGGKPRIVVTHGSTQDFGPSGAEEEEEGDAAGTNLIDLDRLDGEAFDYVALGDWHGTKRVGERAWYSGTPEPDRFARGEAEAHGNVLAVTVGRGGEPGVEVERTGQLGWHVVEVSLGGEHAIEDLDRALEGCVGSRTSRDLVRLTLEGRLGLEAMRRLEQVLETWEARLLRLKRLGWPGVAPSVEELDGLTRRAGDPLISRVATRLVAALDQEGNGEIDAEVARVALAELYAACEPG